MGNPYYSFVDPIYQPAMRVVQAITNARAASVTTTIPHLYITGTVVRIEVPVGFGMQQINQQTGTIVVTSANTYTINIDTSLYDPLLSFGSWPSSAYSYPLCTCVGEDNSILTAAVQNVL